MIYIRVDKNVQLPGSKGYDDNMRVNTTPQKKFGSIARIFQNHLSNLT